MTKNPHDRARELHDLKDGIRLPLLATLWNIYSIIGTNEEYMRLEIRKSLFEHEIIAKSRIGNYAEENVMDEAEARHLTLTSIGAGRSTCLDCEEKINGTRH